MILCVVNSRPHPRPSSQSASLLPFSLYVLASLLPCFVASLPPHPSYPFSFHTLAHSLARAKIQLLSFQWLPHSLPRNPRGGGTDSLRQRLQPDSASLASFRHLVPYTG